MALGPYRSVPRVISLFPYQEKTVENIRAYFAVVGNKDKSFLVTYPMGGGKSHLISLMALVEDGNVLILAPSLELLEQISRKVAEFKKDHFGGSKVLLSFETLDPNALGSSGVVVVDTFQQLYSIYRNDPARYESIRKIFQWTFVDEGHREPSPKWSFAIRRVESKKVLFTATPYRNDFNVFEIEDTATHIESYHTLSGFRTNGKPLLRDVVHKQETWKPGNPGSFIPIFLSHFGRVCTKDLKAIIRCDKPDDISRLVRALNQSKPGIAVGVHTNFNKADNSRHLYHSYFNVPSSGSQRIFVHQNKLIEGVDNKDFVLLAFYDDIKSERSLIQQIGRVLRYKNTATATVISHKGSRVKAAWEDFLEFDKNLGTHKKLWGLKTFSREYLKHINQILYENTAFRKLLDLNLSPEAAFSQLMYRKTVNVYECEARLNFDDLVIAFEQDFADTQKIFRIRKSDIASIGTPFDSFDDFYILCFMRVENTEVFSDTFFPEIRLELTGIYRKKNTVFYYCSERRASQSVQEKLGYAPYSELIRFLGKDPTFTQVSLNNMDISDGAIRQRIVRARDLNSSLSSNLDYSSYLGNSVYRSSSVRGYLGVENSKFTEFSSKPVSNSQFFEWLDSLETRMKTPIASNKFLERFAKVVTPGTSMVPKHILLDLVQAEDFISDAAQVDLFIELLPDLEKSFEVKADTKKAGLFYFDFEVDGSAYRVDLKQANGRFHLSTAAIGPDDSDYASYCVLKACLRALNTKQLFRIVFETKDVIYSLGRFFSIGSLESLKSIVYGDPSISRTWSEKGDELLPKTGRNKVRKWRTSLFKYITDYNPTSRTVLYKELGNIDYLVCDDRGARQSGQYEAADFLAITCSGGKKKIVFIHCKSKPDENMRATALYDVTAQAIKSLRFLNPFYPHRMKDDHFEKSRNLGKYQVSRVNAYRGRSATSASFMAEYRKLLVDPSAEREVWIVMGGGANSSQLEDALTKPDDQVEDHLIQAKFILYSAWASVSSANAKLKFFCPTG